MTLSKTNPFVQLGFGVKHVPYETSLCELFWRVVGKLFLLSAYGVPAGILLALWLSNFIEEPLATVLWTGGALIVAAGLIGLMIACCMVYDHMEENEPPEWLVTKADKLHDFVDFVRGNYCPKIDINHES